MKQNINIEAEGNELVLKNKAGDYVIIPKKYRTEVQDMIKDGCHGCIDALVETLPVMEDYAQDGTLYPEEPSINPNSPIKLPEVTITAEAPTYIKYRQAWEKENPFDIDKYVENRFNNPVGREAIKRINEKAWKETLRQEGLKKRQTELNEATKMGLLYQRFNPQNKDDMPIADEQFEKRYGTSPHRYRYDNDPEYRKYYEQQSRNATSTIDYPSTDLRRKDVVAPNNMWMYPNLTGESKAQATNFSNEVIEMALPIPGLETMGKIPSVFKAGKALIKPMSKVVGKIDDVVGKVSRYLESPDPNNYYRVIGNKEGYDDLITSGIVRPNQSGIFKGRNTYYTKGNINDKFNPVISGGVKKNTIYDGEYIVEIKPNNLHFPTDNHGLHKKWNFGLTTAGNEIPYSSEYLNVYKYNTKVKKYELLDKFLNKTDDVVKPIVSTTDDIVKPIDNISLLKQKEIDWLNSEEYIFRKMQSTGMTRDAIIKDKEKILKQLDKTNINFLDAESEAARGIYVNGKNPRIDIFKHKKEEDVLNTLSHEIKHAASEQAIRSGDPLIDLFTNPYKRYDKVSTKKWYDNLIPGESISKWASHPAEQQTVSKRAMDLIESTQNIKRGTELTDDNFKKLFETLNEEIRSGNTQNSDIISMFRAIYRKHGKEKAIKLIKNMVNNAYSIPAIGTAAYLQSQNQNKTE